MVSFMNKALLEFDIDNDCLLIDFLKNNIEKSISYEGVELMYLLDDVYN